MSNRLIIPLAIMAILSCSIATAEEKVGALGYIRPASSIIRIMGPSGDAIEKMMVKEGDTVQKETPLILFSSKKIHEAEVSRAESELQRIDKLGKMAISMQDLKVKKAAEDYEYAKQRLIRLQEIAEDSVSLQAQEQRKYELFLSEINLDMSQMELERLKLEHDMNVNRAKQDLELAKLELANSIVRSPITGTILDIFQSEGANTTGEAIMTLADLSQMYVVAEIFEADILKLSVGMRATLTSKSLPDPLHGKIVKISRILDKVSKVADVKIRLEDPEIASRLINLEVDVSILTDNNSAK